LLDHRAVAAAARARLREPEQALALDLHAAAVALRADDRRRPRLRARAAALAARRVDLDRDLRLDPLERVLEGQVDDRLDVGAARRLPLGAGAAAAAEEPAEEVAQVADVEVEVRAAVEPRRTVRTEGVVLLALVRVGEQVVG